MPQPTRSQVHINAPLTNVSVAYLQAQAKFVARQVFPAIPVSKQSDAYFTYPKGQWFTDEMQERAPGTESAGSGYPIGSDTYGCRVWSLHRDVADQIRENADSPIDLDKEATEWLTLKWLIRQERLFASNYFTTGVWTGSSSGGDIAPATKWDAAGSDPVNDVEVQMDAMERQTSFRPNVMVVTSAVNTALKNNADIKDRVKYTQRATITEELLASLFGVEKYVVARATYNSAAEPSAAAMSFITGGDGVLLAYAPPSPGLLTPSAGYIFDWTGMDGGGAQGQRIKTFRMEHLASDRVEIEAAFDMKRVASDLGVFFNDVLAGV